MNEAKEILETVYNTVISKNGTYYDSLRHLDQNGELGNKRAMMEVVSKLCALIDRQQQKIEALEAKLTPPSNEQTTNRTELGANTTV